jgi:hypothetical protein
MGIQGTEGRMCTMSISTDLPGSRDGVQHTVSLGKGQALEAKLF